MLPAARMRTPQNVAAATMPAAMVWPLPVWAKQHLPLQQLDPLRPGEGAANPPARRGDAGRSGGGQSYSRRGQGHGHVDHGR